MDLRADRFVWLLGMVLALGGFVAAAAGNLAHGADSFFTAAFEDNAIVAGQALQDWHADEAKPKLNGAEIFAEQRPIRWLWREAGEPLTQPKAFLDLSGGDRLPGRVIEYRWGHESSDPEPSHLLIVPEIGLDLPGQGPRPSLRVRVADVRRIVWHRRASEKYRPNTVFLADGSEVVFRSLRWSSSAVTLLMAEGTRKVGFAEIAELHLPRRDNWDAYYDTLAQLTPACDARLMQVETSGGLVATCSLNRLRAHSTTGSDPQGWYHMLQPAWSLDPLWLRHASINWRRWWLPQNVPLSILAPDRLVERPLLGRGWELQVNNSVRDQPLRAAANFMAGAGERKPTARWLLICRRRPGCFAPRSGSMPR